MSEAESTIGLSEHLRLLKAAVIEAREQGALKMRADLAAYAARYGHPAIPWLATTGEKKDFERAFDARIAAAGA